MDENEVERRLRAGLERHAAEADVTVPVTERARREVGRRRRTRWTVVAAAAAVVLVVGGVAVATQGGDDAAGPPVADDPTASETPGGAGAWRTEHWGDVAVDVPADWGYGGAPLMPDGTACYPEAMVDPDGERLEGADGLGWVGRPIGATDVCALVPRAWEPTAPYVWLGALVEPGTVEYDNGYVQETVEVNGSTVTVGAKDAALRERILGSVRGGEMCLSEIDLSAAALIGHDPAADPQAEPAGLRVCAYRRSERSSTATLSYATEVGVGALSEYEAALERGDPPRDQCPALDYMESEWVVLEVVDTTGSVLRQDVVHLFGSCAGIGVDTDRLLQLETTRLTPAMVEPWAVGGIPVIVHGPTGGKGATFDSFIGPQG